MGRESAHTAALADLGTRAKNSRRVLSNLQALSLQGFLTHGFMLLVRRIHKLKHKPSLARLTSLNAVSFSKKEGAT